jgi:hypothetical protein
LAKWTLDEQVAIATRLEVVKWLNPETQELELMVRIVAYTGDGTVQVVYKSHDLMQLIEALMSLVQFLIEQGLDEEGGA